MSGTDLQRVTPSMPRRAEIEELTLLGNQLGRSGFFKDVHSGFQGFAKLVFGRDLGLSATAAMTGIHIIEGKPEISANVQAQMVRTYIGPEGERYDFRVREHSNEKCRIEFRRRDPRTVEWEILGESEYTMQDARLAGLDGKHNWKKHPRNMLFARAMSDGVAFHCPEVANGIRTYHEGEIDVDRVAEATAPDETFTVANGEVLDGEVVPEEVEHVDEATVSALIAAREESGITAEQLRMQLISAGVDDVPENVTKATFKRLTPGQASELQSALNAMVDAKAVSA